MATPTQTAAIPPPTGQVSDFSAPNDLWQWNILGQTLCLGIPGILWLLRLYVRIWVKRAWILEDSLAVLSYATLLIYGMLLTSAFSHQAGVHQWNLLKPSVINVLYWENAVQIWYGVAAAAIKSTILVLYLRVFSPRRWTPFDTSIRIFILIVVILPGAISIAKIFQCTPRSRIWDSTVPGTCVNLAALLDTSGVFNILSDILILLIPIKGLWGLKMDRKRKIGIYAVFTVGIIGPAFSIIGLVMRLQLATSKDQTYNQPIISLWAMAELATGMMVICLPTLPGLLLRRRKAQSSRGTRGMYHGSAQMAGRYGISGRRYSEIDEYRTFRSADRSVLDSKHRHHIMTVTSHTDDIELSSTEGESPERQGYKHHSSDNKSIGMASNPWAARPVVVSTVEAGYAPHAITTHGDARDSPPQPASAGRILKTVTVEQVRARSGS